MSLPRTLKTTMTPFPYSVDESTLVREARRVMEEHGVHHLPVTDGRNLVGIFTSRDIMAAAAALRERERGGEATVKDVCVGDPYVVDLDEPLDAVLLTMAERHIGSAIVTRKDKLAGVYTWLDACRSFGTHLRENFPHPEGDAAA